MHLLLIALHTYLRKIIKNAIVMSIANNNTVARVAAVVAGLGLVASSFAFAPAASAQSSVDAQIAALMAQIAALQAQTGGTASANASFNRDLTLGSTGADVTALQNWLIANGASIPAGATGYFGGQTQAALAKWQASVGITPAAGYFGPITRAKVNASAGGSTGGNTGGTTGGDDDDTDLQGGAGSIEDATFISNLNNEEVGEDEDDVEVAGLEIEADDGSDIEITAVRLDFGQGTADQDFEDYASEVSVWFDGEELARVDAEDFDDDNSYSKTISLDSGAVIDAGETGELTVAVTGISNLDSADAGDTWNVEFENVRFRDADGATITESATGDINGVTRTFSFATFASAVDAELKISEDDDDINDARTLEVDDSDNTDDVEVLSFTLEAEGDSDLEIKNWGVSVTVTGATDTDAVVSALTLWIDGEEVASADTVSSAGTTEFYNFDDVDYTIGAGDTVEVLVKADFNDIETTAFDEGDTISFALGEEQTDVTATIDVEDESGEQLVDADITGSVDSGAFELRSRGIMVTFI